MTNRWGTWLVVSMVQAYSLPGRVARGKMQPTQNGPAKVQTLLAWLRARCFKLLNAFNRAVMLLLVKCYDKKWFLSPYNWVIYPLTQPQVANQQKKHNFEPTSNNPTKSLKLFFTNILFFQDLRLLPQLGVAVQSNPIQMPKNLWVMDQVCYAL